MKNLFEPKNECGKKDLLVAYLYDETSKAERGQFEQHLPTCNDCRNELQAFKGVRNELSAWEMPVVPHIQFVPPRSALSVLREFLQLVPTWLKLTSGLATAIAAALVLFALTGLNISVGKGNFSASFGNQAIVVAQSPNPSAQPVKIVDPNVLSRAEVEKMIQFAVAQTKAEAQQHTQIQLASLEAKLLASHQTNLQNASLQFRKEYQRRLQTELAKFDNGSRQSLTDWLFADSGNPEKEGKSNDENN